MHRPAARSLPDNDGKPPTRKACRSQREAAHDPERKHPSRCFYSSYGRRVNH
jgi:hypothetical protein